MDAGIVVELEQKLRRTSHKLHLAVENSPLTLLLTSYAKCKALSIYQVLVRQNYL